MLDIPFGRREVQEIFEEYGLGRVGSVGPAPFAWWRRTNHQQNLLVDVGRGKYILRLDGGRGEIEMKREIDLLLYLRKHDFPCPQPIPDLKSRHFRSVGGACLTAFKNIDGRAMEIDTLSRGHVQSVGRAVAELHLIGKGYKKGIDNRFSFERIAELYGEARATLPVYFRRITRTLDEEIEHLGGYLEGKLPKGVIAGDLLGEALLFKGDKLVGILEFEAACRGKFIFDLASAVNAVCFTQGRYDLARFEALIEGYESVRTLSLAEWDAFPNELRFSAFRCTITSLRDVLSLPAAADGLAAITEERALSRARLDGRDRNGLEDAWGRSVRAFQGFFDRLSILRREREGGMESMLLAMATGYDYRRYQKVKAGERRAAR